MTMKKSVLSEPAIPLHTALHRRVQELPGVTNVMIANTLGYPRPNVVAMILNGSMKLPINKVPALARVLEIDPLALLRRVMAIEAPDAWESIEHVFGGAMPLTDNEKMLMEHVREQLAGEDVALMDNKEFRAEVTCALLKALDRHIRVTLAEREVTRGPRDSRAARECAEMLFLLEGQARERAELRLAHRDHRR